MFGKKKTEEDRNIESLMAIPDSLVDRYTKDNWIARAKAGDDIYAYTAGPDHFWNVWIGDEIDLDTGYRGVRIELGVEHG